MMCDYLWQRQESENYYHGNNEMNLVRTATAFWDAKVAKTVASFDIAEPPPAKSDSDLMAMKGVFCWRQTKATAALSMSIELALNLEFKNSL